MGQFSSKIELLNVPTSTLAIRGGRGCTYSYGMTKRGGRDVAPILFHAQIILKK